MIVKNQTLSTTEQLNSRILIVDNNISNILEMENLLQGYGTIDIHQNPVNTTKNINNTKYDLIIIDIDMQSGFNFAKLVKKSFLNFLTPIIFTSRYSNSEIIVNCYRYESASFIKRPFTPMVTKTQIYNILKTEALKRSIEIEKENFIATLTHDLKSPINAEICALTQLLKKDDNKNEMLEELLNSAKYMKSITENILCFYKHKNKGLSLNKEFVDFKDLITSSINDLKYLANDKNIQINFNSLISNTNIELDALEIKRVINNLISNAIEYSYKNNCIDIELNLLNNHFVFEIKDYGIGIDTKHLNNIFDEYMSLAKEHKKTGFGLGLNICKKIIEQHNGEISINSKYGSGTSIKFQLPA